MGSVGKAVGKFVGKTVGGVLGGVSSGAPKSNYQYQGYDVNSLAFANPYFDKNQENISREIANARGGLNPMFESAGSSALSALQSRVSGVAPSVAEIKLRQGQERLKSQLASELATQRGGNAGLSRRQMMNALASGSTSLEGEAAQLRAQEQAQAEKTLLDAYGQSAARANQATQFYTSLGMQDQQARMQALQDLERFKAAQQNFAQTGNAGVAASNQQSQNQFLGGLLGAGGAVGAAALSDKNQKSNIKTADDELYRFLDLMKPYSYRYKDSSNGEGKYVSPMAQDLEKSPVSKNWVVETPEGKAVDYGKGLGALLAAQAALHKRLKKVEGDK